MMMLNLSRNLEVNGSRGFYKKPDQALRTAYLPYALLIVSSLRLYALWRSGLTTRYDMLISLCALSQVLGDTLLRTAADIKLPHEAVDVGNNGDNDSTQPDPETKPSTLMSVATFLQKRKASVEVIAIAAVLRVSWDPHDRSSALIGWTSVFAGCFAGTAQLFIRERMQKSSLLVEDWIVCYAGMCIAFLV